MRIRWRGLELPGRVVREDAVSTNSFARFVIEPFERGFGTTIGNSLRRVLLSSLEGAAVTSVKIAGVSHEFTHINGVLEDVTDILLNIKGIIVRYDGEGPRTISIKRDTPGEILASHMVVDPSVTIVNPDHLVATLTGNVRFHLECTVNTGRGYATAADNRGGEQELGVIPIDSVFSPVVRVRYRTEDMRLGQLTNYDRLILEIWTNGTVLPEDALVEAALILRKHLNPFVLYHELGKDVVATSSSAMETHAAPDSEMDELLNRPVSSLSLSVRASNCLEAARVTNLRELVANTEADLLRFRSFGKTSLHEVQRKLTEVGLSLGMKFNQSAEGPTPSPADDGPDGGSPGTMAAYTMGD